MPETTPLSTTTAAGAGLLCRLLIFQSGLRCSRVASCMSKIRRVDVVTKWKPEFEEFRGNRCVEGQITLMLRQAADQEPA